MFKTQKLLDELNEINKEIRKYESSGGEGELNLKADALSLTPAAFVYIAKLQNRSDLIQKGMLCITTLTLIFVVIN